MDELLGPGLDKVEEVELIDLTDSELASVKKNIYDEAFKKFEEEYGKNVSQLCSFFDIDLDIKDKSKTLREIFKNIKSRMIGYIDFDDVEMPIPAKFNAKMINIKNPHEEVANDVINRLNFLFEVRSSKSYQHVVTKQLKIVASAEDSSEVTFEEDES